MWSSMHPRQLQSSTSFCTLRIGCPACTIHPHSTLWWLQSINSRAMVSTSYLIFHRPHHFTPICCHMPLSFPLTFMHWRRVTICMTSQYQPRPICMCSFFSVADSNFCLGFHITFPVSRTTSWTESVHDTSSDYSSSIWGVPTH